MAYGQKQTDTLPRFHSYIREATLGRLLLKTNGCNGSRVCKNVVEVFWSAEHALDATKSGAVSL